DKSILNEKVIVEKGYFYINKIVNSLDISFEFFLFFITAVSILLKYKFLKKHCKYYLLGLFIYLSTYLFFQEFIQIRQALSISLLSLSFPFILEKKIFKFLIVIYLASFFHSGSFVFIPVYFCWNTRIKKYIEKYYCTILFLSFLSSKLLEDIFINMSIYLPGYSKIQIYLEQKLKVIPYRGITLGLLFSEIKKRIKFKLSEMDKLVFFIFKIGIIFCILFMNLGDIAFRIRIYFLWLECYIISIILEKIIFKINKIYLCLLIGLFYLFIFQKFLNSMIQRGYFSPYLNFLIS
ncbi:MAG: EpsG family protein, partial [Cetobacterium sp.]